MSEPSRRERNKSQKRRRLEEAGLRAFLEEGYTGASIERIVAEAKVGRGTFYLYFKNKEDLFGQLIARFYVPLRDAVAGARDELARAPDTPASLAIYARLGAALLPIVLEHSDEVRLYCSEARAAGAGGNLVRRSTRRLEATTREVLEDAVQRGLLRPHDTYAVSVLIVGAIEHMIWTYLQGHASLDPERVPAEVILFFRHGLAA
jgi:AcrR family transcriptional regulator